jgi:glycyl-tRNA synthetase beta chain
MKSRQARATRSRCAALGTIRLILENGLRLALAAAFDCAAAGVRDKAGSLTAELLGFIADRLKVHLRDQGVRHDLIGAVFALAEDDLVRLLARVDALAKFLKTEDGADLLIAYRRAANIVRIEEQRDKRTYDGPIDRAGLAQREESELYERLAGANVTLETSLRAEDFDRAMTGLAALRQPVDEFFDKVTVNAEDPELRANRLRLLSRIRATMNQVADFSQIEG